MAFAPQQGQRIGLRVGGITLQRRLGFLDKGRPQVQIAFLMLNGGMFQDVLARQFGLESGLGAGFCSLRTRAAAAFSVNSVLGAAPLATHTNSVSSEPSSQLPPVALSQALETARSWWCNSLAMSSRQKYRPSSGG